MKIIFLNTWGGRLRDEIYGFLREHAADTDVFCLQEVYPEMADICSEVLTGYDKHFFRKTLDAGDIFPQATFVRKGFSSGPMEIIMENEPDTGLGISVTVTKGDTPIHICNVHGWWKPGDKRDSQSRLRQSETLLGAFHDRLGITIIGGDFNIRPESESIRMFSEHGYRDLIAEYGIETTRNHYAWDLYPDKMYHSNYVFVNSAADVYRFEVLDIEVSDHLPIILEIGD